MVDENERERTRQAPGLRAVVEVLKSRVSVSVVSYQAGSRWTLLISACKEMGRLRDGKLADLPGDMMLILGRC